MPDQHTVETGRARLAYRVCGPPDAPPLVLLHALGEGARDWEDVTPAFSRRRRVYAVDLRGHGGSDRPGAYSLELMRDDVLGFLDALALDRVDLIGHSLGGMVAWMLAAAHPQRLDRLILEDVPAPLPRERVVPERPEGPLSFDWDMVLAVRQQIDTPDAAWLALLGRITARTLVLAGGPQSPVPQERIAELARRVPHARLLTVPAGHLIHRTAPGRFTDAVLEFLEDRAPSGGG
ncbi:alpha/beta fold hydrolase [Streptomyces meridianus]|uniref:Alpha/beta hydrolase n=1 Tax=Streptomyces meridianus TaxID=2938945 RepID=A0ABT0X8T4_9ACTN|nr:alpha/beta hydrolase [Streptomyces meridianus]MCM2578735.1 alpha/beta hydrolase [Streptomyces meridianus]